MYHDAVREECVKCGIPIHEKRGGKRRTRPVAALRTDLYECIKRARTPGFFAPSRTRSPQQVSRVGNLQDKEASLAREGASHAGAPRSCTSPRKRSRSPVRAPEAGIDWSTVDVEKAAKDLDEAGLRREAKRAGLEWCWDGKEATGDELRALLRARRRMTGRTVPQLFAHFDRRGRGRARVLVCVCACLCMVCM